MNIILIGFMGSGKSEVGHKLAQRLKMNYIDCDEIIEKSQKRSISEIFKTDGEEHFRNLETEVIRTLEDYDGFVISTGGGMILREENVRMLKEIGPLVLLWADKDVVCKRLAKAENRPLLEGDREKRIKEILEFRTPIYNRVADLKVDTSRLSVDEALEEIIKYAENKS